MKNICKKLLLVSLICTGGIGTIVRASEAMVDETKGAYQVGRFFYSWEAKGDSEFCKNMKKCLTKSGKTEIDEGMSIPSLKNREKLTMEIDAAGNLSLYRDAEEYIVVEDQDGKKQFDSNELSLDEEDEKEVKTLSMWQHLVAKVGNNELIITKGGKKGVKRERTDADEKGIDEEKRIKKLQKKSVEQDEFITLVYDEGKHVREEDKPGYRVRLATFKNSPLVAAALSHGKGKIEKKVKLNIADEEIITLLRFLESDEQGREKLLVSLSITDHQKLAANLHEFGFTKEFCSDYFDFVKNFLRSRMRFALEQNNEQEIASWQRQRVNVQQVIEEVFREIIQPIPKVLKKCDDVIKIDFNLTWERALFIYKNGGCAIVNTENWQVIVTIESVCWHNILFSPDGKKIIIAYRNGKKEIRKTEDGSVVKAFENVGRMEFSPDGKRIVVTYRNGKKEIRSTEDGQLIAVIDNVDQFEFSPDGKRIALNYENGKGELRNTEDGQLIIVIDGVDHFEFSPDGKRIIVEREDGKTEIRNAKDGKIIFPPIEVDIDAMEFSPNGKSIVFKYEDGETEVRNTKNGQVIFSPVDKVTRFGFSADGKRIAIYYANGNGEIRSAENGQVIFSSVDKVTRFGFSADGKRIAICYANGNGEIRSTEDGQVIFFLVDKVTQFRFSADGKRIAICYANGNGEIRSTKDGHIIFPPVENVNLIKFSPDGKKIKIVYKNRKIEIRSTENQVVFSAENVVIRFSPDGKKIEVIYAYGRREIRNLVDYNRGLNFVKFSPNQLLFIYKLSRNPHYFNQLQDISDVRRAWQSLTLEIQQKLKESYFHLLK